MKTTKRNVYLRILAQDDLDRILSWHNDPALYSTLGGQFRYVSRESEAEWLRRRLEARDEVNLAICLSDPSDHIGNVYLRNINWIDRNCELHTFIAAKEHRGKGYGSTAVRLITKHAFEDLGLIRIYLHVLASNSAAIAAYEKCGFLTEGRLRRHALNAGVLQDMLIMGFCRE
jgi:RimJ/RimL family protein N-acetyltransferase